MTDSLERSDAISYNDMTVTIPPDEPQIFKAVRMDDLSMLRNQQRLGVDMNILHEGSECMIKSPRLSRHIRLTKYSPLVVAVMHSKLETIEWLVNNGASVNLSEGSQRTPLYLAVATGRADVAQYLIDKGADVNSQTKSLRTPLLEAVDVHSPDIVSMLIEAGADLDLADIKGTTPLLDASFKILRDKQDFTIEIIKLLIKGGCNVNKTNNLQATPLMMAIGTKSYDVIELLLDSGADVNHMDNKKRTAFHLLTDHTKITGKALQLIQRGADMNTKDSDGKTPLEKVTKTGKIEMIKFLLHSDCKYNKELVHSERMKYLCEVVPGFGDWLTNELGTVKSLQRLCRLTVRNATPTDQLKNIPLLELPVSLINYLMFKSG